jgi:uncharacterized protein (TIGR02118 family)
MVKVILLLKRKPGMSRAEFREHYERVHVVLAKKYLGHLFAAYRRNYAVDAMSNTGDAHDDGYDAVTEVVLKDAAAAAEMNRIINSPEIGPIYIADEEKFLDRPALRMLIVEEVDTGTR